MSFSNDIVKYLTQEFVRYIDTPKNERKRKQKEQWSSRMFGMIPMSLRIFSNKVRKTKE
ncbi:MAG TPA: YqzE family protein [Bacillota bacterium]|nr:YqzE family protein [Bacillota bacterium]